MTLRLRGREAPEQTWLYAGNSVDPHVPRRGKNRGVRTIRREGRSQRTGTLRDCTPGSGLRRMMIQSTPRGDTGDTVNKVSVGEPADGSPPKQFRGDPLSSAMRSR